VHSCGAFGACFCFGYGTSDMLISFPTGDQLARDKVSQPNVYRIRDLEDQLGMTLFVRVPRRRHLTPAGLKLLEHSPLLFIRLERT